MSSRSSGFTLLEVLVVVALISIIVGFVVLSIGDGGKTQLLEQNAKRLASLLKLVSEEAILTNQEFALAVTEEGYEFQILDGKDWAAIADDPILRARQLESGMRIALSIDNIEIDLQAQDDKQPDRLFLLSSGEMTPFEITLKDDASGTYFNVIGAANGQLNVLGPLKEQ